jgi:hypothetical protein
MSAGVAVLFSGTGFIVTVAFPLHLDFR